MSQCRLLATKRPDAGYLSNQLPMDRLSSDMDAQHPHFGATYRTDQQSDGSFCVEVSIPDTSPVKVSGFGTQALAGAWVANHQRHVAEPPKRRSQFRPWKK